MCTQSHTQQLRTQQLSFSHERNSHEQPSFLHQRSRRQRHLGFRWHFSSEAAEAWFEGPLERRRTQEREGLPLLRKVSFNMRVCYKYACAELIFDFQICFSVAHPTHFFKIKKTRIQWNFRKFVGCQSKLIGCRKQLPYYKRDATVLYYKRGKETLMGFW